MDDFYKKTEPYFESLVLIVLENTKVVKLVRATHVQDEWTYLVDDGKELHQYSCLCPFIPLKGHLRKQDYESLLKDWNDKLEDKKAV